MSSLVVIKKPESMVTRQRERRNIDLCWSDIVSWIMDHPDVKNETLFNMFGDRSGSSDCASFMRKCNSRGLAELRREVKKKPKVKDSLQLTETAITRFQKERREKGVMHLSRMDEALQPVYKAIEKQGKKISTKKALNQHLGNLNLAQKLGKDVYGIGQDSSENNSKINLAIMMNFDPSSAAKPTSGKVVDI